MNQVKRNQIAKKSDYQLSSDIERQEIQLLNIPKRMASTRISANKRQQAHLDELQKRLLKKASA